MNVSLAISKKKCIACGSADFVSFYKSARELELINRQKIRFEQHLESCYRCGLVRQQENATYSDDNLNKYYTSTPRTPLNPDTLDKKDKRKLNAQQRLKFIRTQKTKGSLLEVGFGDGVFLNEARKVYDCTGIDPSEGYSYVHEYLSGKGVKVYNGGLKSFSSRATFDVVCSFLVMEHIKNPLIFLKQLKRHLKSTAILILEVPDISRYKLFNTESMLTHEHVYHYTIDTLVLVLAQLGLELVSYSNKNVSYGFSLIAAFRLKKKAVAMKQNLTGFKTLTLFEEFIDMREKYRIKMTQTLRELIDNERNAGKKIAVYGTGFLFNFARERCGLNVGDIGYFYDDTKEKAGSKIGPREIYPLRAIAGHAPDVVLIFSEMFFDLLKQNVLGYVADKNVTIVNIHKQSI